jgi:hypothetical protein
VRRRWLAAVATAWAAAAAPAALRAQAAGELLAQGLRAYQSLEYDAAAGLLRRSLALTGADPLADGERARALMYLGATEIFRSRRDSALTAFRRLVLLDPRFRSDQLVFPPEVTNTFDLVRRAVPAVSVVATDAEIRLGDALYPVQLYASAFHDIQAVVLAEDGRLVRQLYIGPIADSLVVRWDGLDSAGTGPALGRFQLVVVSRNPRGQPLRRVQVALETSGRVPDSLPHPRPPAGSLLRPERRPPGPAWRALLGGVVAGGAAALLPAVITGDGSNGTGARFVVAGTLGLTGVIGFLAQRPGQALPANAAANRAARDAWQRQVAATVEENARRAADVSLRITPGRITRVEREGP